MIARFERTGRAARHLSVRVWGAIVGGRRACRSTRLTDGDLHSPQSSPLLSSSSRTGSALSTRPVHTCHICRDKGEPAHLMAKTPASLSAAVAMIFSEWLLV